VKPEEQANGKDFPMHPLRGKLRFTNISKSVSLCVQSEEGEVSERKGLEGSALPETHYL